MKNSIFLLLLTEKNYSWEHCDVIIASLDTAKREPHQEDILQIDYDFIIIDEAHKLKKIIEQKNYSFVKQLKKEILSTFNSYTNSE